MPLLKLQKTQKPNCRKLVAIFIDRQIKILEDNTKTRDSMNCQQLKQNKIANLPLRARGSHSKKFKPVQIQSNHFEVCLKNIKQIFVYSMKITPPIESRNTKLRQQIVSSILPQVRTYIPNPIPRGFNIFSHEESAEKQFQVKSESHRVSIQQTKAYDLINKKVLQLFINVTIRGMMNRNGYEDLGKPGKYFDTKKQQKIDKLIVYPGFSSSCMQLERGMYLRVDTARKIVNGATVLTTINAIYQQQRGKDKQERRNQVTRIINNTVVMTNYGKKTFYRVINVVFDLKLEDVRVSNDYPTLGEYYTKRYNLTLLHPNQPLLQVYSKNNRGPNSKTYLLPQFCLMTGIPTDFDEKRRKAINDAMTFSSTVKLEQIQSLIGNLQAKGEIQQLQEIGIKLKTKPHQMQAKIISPPTLSLGQNRCVDKGKQSFFSLFKDPIYSHKHDLSCIILYFKTTDISQLVSCIQTTSKSLLLKLNLAQISMGEVQDEKSIIQAIDKALSHKLDPNILMVVLPTRLKNSYAKFKKYTLAIQPDSQVLTQFVLESTLQRKSGLQTVYTKLLLQMAAKRGNILWATTFDQQMQKRLQGVMLLGLDSSEKAGKNILAACGTTNSTFSSIASSTKQFQNNQTKFKAMVASSLKCIQNYQKRNKTLPRQIVIFMNSCTGDQVKLYQQNYASALQNAVLQIYGQTQIRLTIVMVNLKSSQRFFTKDKKNVPPGTLVNSEVVSLDYDFFIVSQQSSKGCVVPNHYKVIYNTGELQEGHLQELIYSQCFNYANWSGSIKLPAILQYAKKCVKFSAEVLGGVEVEDSLNVKPFFI